MQQHSIHMVIGCDALPQDRGKVPKCATTNQEGVVYCLQSVLSLVPFVLSAITCSSCCSRSVRIRMMYGTCYMIHDTWHCVYTHMVYDVMRALIRFMVYGIWRAVGTLIWYMVKQVPCYCPHYIYVCTCVPMYVRTHVFTYVCMNVCVYVCDTYVNVCVCSCVCIHSMYVCIHICM